MRVSINGNIPFQLDKTYVGTYRFFFWVLMSDGFLFFYYKYRASPVVPSRVLRMILSTESPGTAIRKGREVLPCQDSYMTRTT